TDVFPENAAESADADGDGIGDNGDPDDDNDGANDAVDAFPLDNRGANDADADGIADEWEQTYGLDPADADDADIDADFDGFSSLAEFQAGTDPTVASQSSQIVYSTGNVSIAVTASNTVSVYYRVSDDDPSLNGLGLRLHYDSARVESLAFSDALLTDLIGINESPISDASNYDNDLSTDRYLSIAWASTANAWPGRLPIKLFDLTIQPSSSSNPGDRLKIRFSRVSTDPGYALSASPINATVISMGFDIDGNGTIDALTDGLLLLKSMFGFEGASLIDGTLATNAIYTDATTIESRIADLGSIRDVDGDGDITAMADGLLILRYLFGFRGESLVKDAVAADAVRKTATEIETHLSALVPTG
ncbi:MAG TPA: hypothetical protein QF520_10230, partial [SAR202 cluster bacterium]|nr:hypothetical protein [SAR202 cluster bacterium]